MRSKIVLDSEKLNEIRKGVVTLVINYPELKTELKRTGYIKLSPDYEDNSDRVVKYNVGKRFMSYVSENRGNSAETYISAIPELKNSGEALKYLLSLDNVAQRSTFYSFISSIGLYLESVLSGEEWENFVSGGDIDASLKSKLHSILSVGEFPASCFKDLYRSEDGLLIPTSGLPSVFSDCYSEYGMEEICVSSVVFYRDDVLKSIADCKFEYEDSSRAYALSIIDKINRDISFAPEHYLPRFNNNEWSEKIELHRDSANELAELLMNVAYEAGVMSGENNCAVCKLHMVGDNPVVSFKNKTGSEDYGVTPIVLDMWKFPISEVYFVISSKNDYEFNSALRRLESNGEYTVTVY